MESSSTLQTDANTLPIDNININENNYNNNNKNNINNDTESNNNISEEFTLDTILVRIGQFGRFQLLVFLMICIPMLFNAIFSVTYIFTASTVVHRCNITECDKTDSYYNAEHTKYSIPMKGKDLNQCLRYVSTYNGNHSVNNNVDDDVCIAENFHTQFTENCPNNNFIFRDKEVTLSNEFDIYCSDEWKLSMVGTINNIGQFFGIPLGGFISDRYGRRTSLALGGFISAIIGLIRSFSPNYIFYLVFEFFDNLASSTLYSTCFIVGIEMVGPKRRVIACSVITIFYAVGEILLAVFAKYYQNWRTLLRIVYIPALIHLAYFWILPESVRWLLSQNKEEPAKKIIRTAAKVNRRKLSEHTLDKVILANRLKLQSTTEGKFPIKATFKQFFWRILNCSLCWIVNVLVYYGISLSAVLLDGDKYNNFMFIALIEIPGFLLPYVTMDRIGRRYSLFGYMVISGLCCLATVFTTDDQYILKLILFLIGKMTITASFQVLYFFTSEIFPTNLRNSMLSFCSMVGRVGSMLAPQTPLLAKVYQHGPAILFTVSAIVSGSLALLFPETTNIVLPTTLKDVGNIGVKEEKSKQLT